MNNIAAAVVDPSRQCIINGIPYYGEVIDVNDIRCLLHKVCAFLFNTPIVTVSYALIALIIFISLFGKIKHHYRWFILNQAIWDIYITYFNSCENTIGHLYYENQIDQNFSCFNKSLDDDSVLVLAIKYGLYFVSGYFSPLLIFTISRFCALYFMNFYSKLTTKSVIKLIILSNFCFLISTQIETIGYYILERANFRLRDEYINLTNGTLGDEYYYTKYQYEAYINFKKADPQYRFGSKLREIGSLINYAKPPICLSVIILLSAAVMFKVLKQAKFQLKQNKKDFLSSLRITFVLIFQVIFNAFAFYLEIGYLYLSVSSLLTGNSSAVDKSTKNYFNGLGLCIEQIRQLRIFLECLIILFVMTGYRECIIQWLKYFIFIKKQNNATSIQPLTPRKTNASISSRHR